MSGKTPPPTRRTPTNSPSYSNAPASPFGHDEPNYCLKIPQQHVQTTILLSPFQCSSPHSSPRYSHSFGLIPIFLLSSNFINFGQPVQSAALQFESSSTQAVHVLLWILNAKHQLLTSALFSYNGMISDIATPNWIRAPLVVCLTTNHNYIWDTNGISK